MDGARATPARRRVRRGSVSRRCGAGRAARRCARGRLAAAADDRRTGLGPSPSRSPRRSAEVVARVEHVDRAAVLRRSTAVKALASAPTAPPRANEFRQGGGRWPPVAPIDGHAATGCPPSASAAVRQRLTAAQPRRAVVGQRPGHPHRLAASAAAVAAARASSADAIVSQSVRSTRSASSATTRR